MSLMHRHFASARLPLLLAAVPPAVILGFIAAFGVDIPVVDQWSVLEDVVATGSGRFDAAALCRFHNEHRIPVPRLVMGGLAALTGWNIRAEMFLNVAVMAMALAAAAMAGRAARGLLPLLSLFMFSLHAHATWLAGFQLTVTLCVFAMLGALALLSGGSPGARRVAGAIGCGLSASGSMMAGFVVWPAGLALLLLRSGLSRRRRTAVIAAWGVAGLGAAVAYVYHLLPVWFGDNAAPAPRGSPPSPAAFLRFAAAFIAGGLLGEDAPAGWLHAAGAGGVAAFLALSVVVLWRTRRDAASTATLALGLVPLLAAAMTAFGRARSAGAELAAASRYCTISSLFWVSLALLLHRFRASCGRRGRRAASVALLLLPVLLLLYAPGGWRTGRENGRRLAAARQALRSGRGIVLEDLAMVAPGWGMYFQVFPGRMDVLRQRRLSLFRDAPPEALVTSESAPPRNPDVTVASAVRRDGVLAITVVCTGGAAGNTAAVEIRSREGTVRQLLGVFDDAGRAVFTVREDAGAGPSGAVISAFGLDAHGRIVRSRSLDWREGS